MANATGPPRTKLRRHGRRRNRVFPYVCLKPLVEGRRDLAVPSQVRRCDAAVVGVLTCEDVRG
jgi:hypothetical protein